MSLSALLVFALAFASVAQERVAPARPAPYGIHVVDAASGRGVPLVVLTTTGGLRYVTDSGGWVAFDEPGLLGTRVWFDVESPGYAAARDGFGYAGVALDTEPGGRGRVQLERTQIAERLYRLTGQGIYRDSVLLGEDVPLAEPLLDGGVVGQDSVVTALLGGRVLWFFGDTNRARYPLGLFQTAGARSLASDALDPDRGIDLDYFTGEDGFARAMVPIEGPGPVWIDGAVVVREDGREVLVAHYMRMKDLGTMLEQGLVRWDEEACVFRKWRELPLEEERHPRGQAVECVDGGTRYLVFATPYPDLRVPARLDALADPGAYEGFTCLAEGAAGSADAPLARDGSGRVAWAWRRGTAPVGEAREDALVKAGRLAPDERLARLTDIESGARVVAHSGSFAWNAHRGRWTWILGEAGGSASNLGEVWFAEADTLVGPWRFARKVATHPGYSFYNVAQHAFLAREGGRRVYFEGTYTRTFSRTQVPTPRYDYNQVMYRLDLDDARLRLPRAVYAWGDGERGTLEDLRAAGLRPADARLVAFTSGEHETRPPDVVLPIGGGEPVR